MTQRCPPPPCGPCAYFGPSSLCLCFNESLVPDKGHIGRLPLYFAHDVFDSQTFDPQIEFNAIGTETS
ncbi:unnamed protein product, partial [Nesidiocoris tenuis]